MTSNTVASYIKVIVRPELDGFYAHSADLPGLSVWGSTKEEMQARVMQAVPVLYRLNNGYEVTVREAADPVTLKPRAAQISDHHYSELIVAREAA